jgi:repressor LexA
MSTVTTEKLTPRQRVVLEFIRQHIQKQGFPPTVREIADHFGIASPNGVATHLKELVRKGAIAKEPNRARTIRLIHAA